MNRLTSFIFLLLITEVAVSQDSFQTFFEESGGKKTPRYAETMAFCRMLAEASPLVSLTSFGKSAQGRDLPLMIADRDGLTSPEAIKATGRLILLIEACIHPGESEGKDAGLMLFRDLAQGTGRGAQCSELRAQGAELGDLLDHVSILFIPIFNVDGHERFGPYNRINQNGPEEMGWRVTATNLNLNRDFLKADAPEMQSWLRLFNAWSPDFFIDIHTTDGADYQYVLTYMMETLGNMDPGLTRWCDAVFLPQWTLDLEEAGYPVFPYVQFRRWHDPKSGMIRDVAPPMLSQGYAAIRNRPGLLIETHMLKPYKQRVEATYECLLSALKILNEQHTKLHELNRDADGYVQSDAFRAQPFPLQYEVSRTDSAMTGFRGVEYEAVHSDLTGGYWFRYSDIPVTFQIPLFETAVPVESVMLPDAYIIPAEWQEVIKRLDLHGISYFTCPTDTTLTISGYKFKDPKWQSTPFEGRHPMIRIQYDTFTMTQTFPQGSVIVPLQQPASRIIAHLLEPNGDGSLLYWGFFDAIFEQKEYFEFYVMEPLAKEMMAEDPELKTEFEAKMASDSTFAKSQWQILNWFLERTPYADTRKMVYPVGRIDN